MNRTKRTVTMGLMAALAFIVLLVCKFIPPIFPAFPFLSYDAKDVVIVISGFIYGPGASFMISVAVSFIEMMFVSDTNIIGCIMNIASTCAFACTAAAIYTKFRSLKGAGAGLLAGTICTAGIMIILNFLLTPIYMNIPREAVTQLLIPAILPFNLIKCMLNSAFTLIVYKPFVKILRRSNLLDTGKTQSSPEKGVILAACVLIIICVIAVYIING